MKLNISNGGDIGGVASRLSVGGVYEPMTTRIMKEIIKPGMDVIDIGANIGYFTLLMAKLTGNHGKVYAFEPEDNNFTSLVSNIGLNGFKNIVPYRFALSDESGEAKLYISEYESGEHSMVSQDDKSYSIDIKTFKLDYAIKGKIDLIKCDTEGNEMKVLLGAYETLKIHHPVLILEIWPDGLKKSGYSVGELFDYLYGIGYNEVLAIDEKKMLTYSITPNQIESQKFKVLGNILFKVKA